MVMLEFGKMCTFLWFLVYVTLLLYADSTTIETERVSNTSVVTLKWTLRKSFTGMLRFRFYPDNARQPVLLATLHTAEANDGVCTSEQYHKMNAGDCSYDSNTGGATLTLYGIQDHVTEGSFGVSSPNNEGDQTRVRIFIYKTPTISSITQEVETLKSPDSPEFNTHAMKLECRAQSNSVPSTDRLAIAYTWIRSGESLAEKRIDRHRVSGSILTISPAYRSDCLANISCVAREAGASSVLSVSSLFNCSNDVKDQLVPEPMESPPDAIPAASPTVYVVATTMSDVLSTQNTDQGSNVTVVVVVTVGIIISLIGIVNVVVCIIWKRRKLEEKRAREVEQTTIRMSKTYETEPVVGKLPRKSNKFKLRPKNGREPPLPTLPRDISLDAPQEAQRAAKEMIYLDILSSMEVSPRQAAALEERFRRWLKSSFYLQD